MSDYTPVEVGQIWADNDRRELGRTIRITAVDGSYAYAVVETPKATNPKGRTGHRVRILLGRMRPTSTGYALVSEDGAA